MKLFHEDNFEYRGKDHGPKYICDTDDFQFALVRFGPGQSHKKHLHQYKDEVFYVLSGKTDIYVGDEKITVEPGNVLCIEAGEPHYIHNPYEEAVKMVLVATRTEKPDKILLD